MHKDRGTAGIIIRAVARILSVVFSQTAGSHSIS